MTGFYVAQWRAGVDISPFLLKPTLTPLPGNYRAVCSRIIARLPRGSVAPPSGALVTMATEVLWNVAEMFGRGVMSGALTETLEESFSGVTPSKALTARGQLDAVLAVHLNATRTNE